MKKDLRADAEKIYTGAIKENLPGFAVAEAMKNFALPEGRLILVAIGKAAWKMAKRAEEYIANELGGVIDSGIVITKYGHSEGKIADFEIYEAAHPIPDACGISATERVLSKTANLTEDDLVLFLISGGGSALFESPFCSLGELTDITKRLLASGADIGEINAVRKHISKVKGGRFAEHIAPARYFAIALSDVLGNRLDTIASGPCAPDLTTAEEVSEILRKYGISVSDECRDSIMRETPKSTSNGVHYIGGSVSELCSSAKRICEELGYKAELITDSETGIACEVGKRLSALASEKCNTDTDLAFIIGGETVVKLKGGGLGGRNQEIALSASVNIAGIDNVAIFSVGSDGTDGPTDAAGGYVDSDSYEKMTRAGVNPIEALENNDSYNALKAIDGLIFTGPTGTNVNDVAVALIKARIGRKRRFANLERVLNEGIENQ
ncbi:MAG: DUF4147 domain-containing protein [Ruminococcaceae bacterium]|nr:DUF4147 domain-containing protein [Oscillospiraceae bacterium]